jgi:hypothetical protein
VNLATPTYSYPVLTGIVCETVARRTQFRLLVAFTIVWIAWAGWSLIGRTHPYQLRVLDDLGAPIASAVVDVGGSQVGTTGGDGRVDMVWRRAAVVLEVGAPGHVSQRMTLSDAPESTVDVVLKARVLRGRVVDSDGEGVGGATVQTGAGGATSDAEGRFQIRGAAEGPVEVTRPAWMATSFEWDGGTGDTQVQIEPMTARAVHIDGPSMRDEFDRFVDMAMETELNALMIDLKDETGEVWYDSENPTAADVGATNNSFDLKATVERAHDLGLYVIGRIVLFNDPIAAVALPDMAVWDTATNGPYEANGQFFLDPTDPAARQYGLELAEEACAAGLDEIQFDYVRFPDARSESATFDGGVSPEVRVSTITALLGEAVAKLRPMGCAVGADIFGYLTTAEDDGGIGQRWEDVASVVDVVSPMLYPSHFHETFYGFPSNERPGDVISEALSDGMERLPGQVVVRPWLQDFGYDASLVREQIAAAEEFGLGWMLWNAESRVSVDALQSAE